MNEEIIERITTIIRMFEVGMYADQELERLVVKELRKLTQLPEPSEQRRNL